MCVYMYVTVEEKEIIVRFKSESITFHQESRIYMFSKITGCRRDT